MNDYIYTYMYNNQSYVFINKDNVLYKYSRNYIYFEKIQKHLKRSYSYTFISLE